MAVGGDIVEITFNHPSSNIGSGVFAAKSGEGNTYDTGGFRTEDDANSVTGSGSPIWKKNRKMGFFQIVVENDMNVNQNLEKIALMAAHPVPAEWTFTVINGAVYKGSGKPVGDITGNINDATVPLKVAGAEFKKISG